MLDTELKIDLKKKGLLEYENINYLFDLYLPILGSNSAFLYLFLVNSVRSKRAYKDLAELIKESKMSQQEFLIAKKMLESIGLIDTYINEKDEKILIVVGDPLTPKNFFNNIILKGLFLQNNSVDSYKQVVSKYETSNNLVGFKDISSKINESFIIDFDLDALKSLDANKLEGKNKESIKDSFSDAKLLSYLKKNTSISISSISEKEIDLAHRLGGLYSLSEATMGTLISEVFDPLAPMGFKINEQKLKFKAKAFVKGYTIKKARNEEKTNLNSNSDISQKIKFYENISPREFLKSKQDNIEIVDADKNLLESLAFTFNMTNGMINALLDYVLINKNGELNRAYVEKIASTLIRKGAKNTLDVLEILDKNSKKVKQEKNENKTININKNNLEMKKENNEDEDDSYDEDFAF